MNKNSKTNNRELIHHVAEKQKSKTICNNFSIHTNLTMDFLFSQLNGLPRFCYLQNYRKNQFWKPKNGIKYHENPGLITISLMENV